MTLKCFYHDLAVEHDIFVIDNQAFLHKEKFKEHNCPRFMWDEETDFVLFKDNKTNLICYIRRNISGGYYTGYVIYNSHFDFEASMFNKPWLEFDVHGGVTHLDKKQNNNDSYTYIVGFDCAHGFDNCPFIDPYNHESYKTMDFAIEQCKLLAYQLTNLDGHFAIDKDNAKEE